MEIESRQEELDHLYFEVFGTEEGREQVEKSIFRTNPEIPDDKLIMKAELAKNGNEFKNLWNGSTIGYNGDDSAADMALMDMLAFWTGGNASQMERLFSRSGLGQRDKWRNRSEYRKMTIQKAILNTTDYYGRSNGNSGNDFVTTTYISEEELNAYSLPEGAKFECRLPKDHFVQRFMAYGSEISDAYPDYWFAGSIFALAVVADKKIKVVLRQGTVYPNLYNAILGKSSLARKSTAADKTEAMLCQVLPQLLPSLVPTEFSPEAFTEHMSDYNHAPWIRDEAAGVLSLMKKEYMRGFKDSLMQLYDSKAFYRKLRTSQRKNTKTEFRVDDPYLNLFFATTDASLGANTEQNDTLSGFLARFLFFFPQGKKPSWMPLEEGTAQNSSFEDVVRDQLSDIAAKVGNLQECMAMHFSPEANSYYTEWQRKRELEWTASNDGFCMQIYSRLAPTVTKLGMLFELGSPDFDVSKPIRLEFIQEACRLVDTYFMPTARAVYDLVGSNAEKNVIDRITAYLKNHNGKATKKEIMRDIKIKSADFNEYLSTMEESSCVESKMVKNSGKGRDSLWVFLLPQTKVGNVANVEKIAKVAKVEKIHSVNIEGIDSTLATLATMATLPTVATIKDMPTLKTVDEMDVDLTPNEEEHKIITLRFLDEIAQYKKDEIAGISEDEGHRLLNMSNPKVCELVLSQEDREHFYNELRSLVREYPFGEVLRRGVIIDDVAAQSNLTRTEVAALLEADDWSPKNRQYENQIWFKPMKNLFIKIGEAKRPLNVGVISDLKSSGYTEQTVNDLFNTFIGGKIGQMTHYRYGAEATTAAN